MMSKFRIGGFKALAARRKRMASEDGNVLVEMALAVPAILLLFSGIVSFASAFNHQLTLTQAVGAGGQYLQQLRGASTDPCADAFTAIQNAAPMLTPSQISLTFTLNGKVISGNTCSGDQTYLVEGAPVQISATYPCALHAYGMNFANTCQLSAQVTEYEY